MRKTTIYLSVSTEDRMRRAARRLDKSRAEITRIALDEYLTRNERQATLPPSVGMGENAGATARDYEERLAERWTSE